MTEAWYMQPVGAKLEESSSDSEWYMQPSETTTQPVEDTSWYMQPPAAKEPEVTEKVTSEPIVAPVKAKAEAPKIEPSMELHGTRTSDNDTGGAKRIAEAAKAGFKEGAKEQPFGPSMLGGLASAPFQAMNAAVGAVTHGAQQVGEELGYKGAGADVEALLMAAPMAHGAPKPTGKIAKTTEIDRSQPPVLDAGPEMAANLEGVHTSFKQPISAKKDLVPTVHEAIDKEIAALKAEKAATKQVGGDAHGPQSMIVDIHKKIDEDIARLEAEKAATKEIKPDDVSNEPTEPTSNLLTAQDVEAGLKGFGSDFVTSQVDSLNPIKKLSRLFSKKNKDVYIGDENVLGDPQLAKISAAREQNQNVLSSMLGTSDGKQRFTYTYKDGQIVRDTDVIPLQTIYRDAVDNGLPVEDAKQFSEMATTLDQYNHNKNKIAGIEDQIREIKSDKSLDKVEKEKQLKEKRKELKELSELTINAIPEEEAQAVFDKLNSTEVGKKFLADRQKWFDKLLTISQEAGLRSPEDVARIKSVHVNYLPIMREKELYGADMQKFKSAKGANTGYKARKGSERELDIDPIENEITRGISTIRMAQLNTERQAIMDWFLQHTDDTGFNAVFRENKADVMRAIEAAKTGKITKLMNDGTYKTFDAPQVAKATDITPLPEILETPGNLAIHYNGRRIDVTFRDTDLYNAIARPDMFSQPIKSKLGQKAYDTWVGGAQLNRNILTTWNPLFSLGATIRTTVAYPFSTQAKITGAGRFNPLKTIKAGYELAKDPELLEYIKSNISPGLITREYKNTNAAKAVENISKNVENMGKTKGSFAQFVDKVRNPGVKTLKNFESFAEYSESINRYRYYKEAKAHFLKEGKTAEEAELMALRAAKNLEANYLQRGADNGLISKLMPVTPFMRTQLNSVVKQISETKYRPKQVMGTMAVMAGGIYTINQYNKQFVDKDGIPFFNKLDPEVKKNNIVIWAGNDQNSYIKIPGGFGALSGLTTVAAQGLDNVMTEVAKKLVDEMPKINQQYIKEHPEFAAYLKQNNLTMDDLMTQAMDTLLGQVNPVGAVPFGASQAGQLALNRDTFGRTIVPEYLKDVDKQQQILPGRTSQTAIELANQGIPLFDSPIVNDWYASAFLGTTGRTLLDASDLIYSAATGREAPQLTPGSIPGVNRFSGLGTDVDKTGITSQYSNLFKKFSGISKTEANLRRAAESGDRAAIEKYQQYSQDYKKVLDIYHNVFEPTNKQIARLYENANRLQQGIKTYSNESTPTHEVFGDPTRRKKLDEITTEIQKLQEKALYEVHDNADEMGDIWEQRLNATSATKGIMGIFQDIKTPKKDIDKTQEKEYNSLFDQLNPISDAGAMEASMLPADINQLEYPPAIEQEASDEAIKHFSTGAIEDWLPNLSKKVKGMYKDNIIGYTIKQEGGDKFTQTAGDRGGATKFGITLETLKEFNPKATVDTLKNLTEPEARKIYQEKYWTKGFVDKMPIAVQDLVFDMNVHHGIKGSALIVQRALDELGAEIKVDGKIGVSTLEAMHDFKSRDLRDAIINQRKQWVDNIVKNDPTQKKFLKGWKNRIASLETIPDELKEA